MEKGYINVGEDKWGIILIYDFNEDDEESLYAIMESFGMKPKDIYKSLRILSTMNSGMAISRDDLQMTAIFIGQPSSPSQFWNSVNHELMHATAAIIDYYDEPYDGEPAAYLQGYLMQRAVEELALPCY